jgi:hypothetical protein
MVLRQARMIVVQKGRVSGDTGTQAAVSVTRANAMPVLARGTHIAET